MQFDACCQSNAFPGFHEFGRFLFADGVVASDLWDHLTYATFMPTGMFDPMPEVIATFEDDSTKFLFAF